MRIRKSFSMNGMKTSSLQKLLLLSFSGLVSLASAAPKSTILSDIKLLDEAKIPALHFDEKTGLATASISSFQQSVLMRKSHEMGRCGGFELLEEEKETKKFSFNDFQKIVKQIEARKRLDEKETKRSVRLNARTSVSEAIANVSEEKIQEWVTWLSAFPTRYHKGEAPNKHVEALQAKLDEVLKSYPALGASTSLISHVKTPQKTVHLRIPGSKFPDEIVAMGAHLDSINVGFIGIPMGGKAPGADDDASGSSSLLEAMRHLLDMAPFDRTVEFFWYAGEEAGLLGSAEIAATYKGANKKVVGVLQLDMTLYPGSGSDVISSINDYTSPEMRALLVEFNRLYLNNITIIDDNCGYGCSDHASWYKNGYPTLFPTEATFNQMNKQIHKTTDVISSSSSFDHAAIFSKIAIAFASHLGTP